MFVLAFALVASMMPLQRAFAEHQEYTTGEILQTIEDALGWTRAHLNVASDGDLLVSDEFLDYAGTSPIDWFAFSLGRLGYPGDYERYLVALGANVTERYTTEAKLDAAKATEWHRIGLTVLALGADPTAFGTDVTGSAIDLVADGTYARGEVAPLDEQGINGYVYALLLLTSLDYEIPEGSSESIESIITGILREQQPGSGFSLSSREEASPDITAMALQALAPFYDQDTTYTYIQVQGDVEVTQTVSAVVDEALAFLSEQQASSGGFGSQGGSDAESSAQVLLALCSLGIDINKDERFIKEGNTALDGLMSFRNDDGGFSRTLDEKGEKGSSQTMATDQALRALIAAARQAEGMNTLYDLRAEESPSLFSLMNVSENTAEAVSLDSHHSSDGEDNLLPIIALVLVLIAVVLVVLVVATVFLKRKKI